MNIEFEAKFIVDVNEFKQYINSIGAKLVAPKKKMRRFNFGIPADKNAWLRVRDEGDKMTFTYKSFDRTKSIDSVQELEVIVNDFEIMCSILQTLGYEKLMYFENYRELWKIDDCSIMIDYWPVLPPIVEIEGPSKEAVEGAVSKLGLDISKAFFGPTGLLYEKLYNFSHDKLKNIRKLTFDDIPEELQKASK